MSPDLSKGWRAGGGESGLSDKKGRFMSVMCWM